MKTLAIIASGAAMSLMLSTAAPAQDAALVEAPAPAQAPQTPQPSVPPAPAEAAPAPVAATPAVAPATGRIYFFRPTRLTGGLYTYHVAEVGDDGKASKESPRLGDLPNGGAFIFEAEPGIHSYNVTGPMADNRAVDRLRMEVEPGETYYVEQTVRMGITGGFKLVPADEARFSTSKVKLDKGKK